MALYLGGNKTKININGVMHSLNLFSNFSEVPIGNIPSYHYDESERVVKRLLELKALYPNNICFGTISDNHVDMTNTNSMTSARHASFALKSVGTKAQCDFLANLGDNISGSAGIDSDSDYANAVYMDNCARYWITSQNGYSLVGNHDKSNSTQKLYDLIGKYNNFDNYGLTRIRGYGYKDFPNKKVRLICLNTCDYWNIVGGNGMSYEQKDFLMRALDLTSTKSIVDEDLWTIVILSHIPLDFLGGDYNKGSDLKEILKAYNDGNSVSITINSNYASAENETPSNYETYNGMGALTYDYSGKNFAKIINIHGHIHTNKYGKLKFIDDNTEFDIVRVATPNSNFNGNASTNRYTEYGDYSITAEEANKIKKVANSKEDTSATFYFIDLDGQVIHSVGYGADIDRTIPYGDNTIYSVAYNLSNVSSSNTSKDIIEGYSYTTILSIGLDYAWDSVVVTMGGVDITSTAYLNGVITISEVTGNIIITAKAKDNYVPHWDIADRTAITNVYELSDVSHECVTSRHNYIYGITSGGIIDYKKISNVSLNGNNVTFTSAAQNYNIGLPYQLEAGATYTFEATASQSARLRVETYDNNGLSLKDGTYSSSGTNLTHTFTANANAGYWTVLMLDVRTAGNTTTFSNISLTKIKDGIGDSGDTEEPSEYTNLFKSTDANFQDGYVLRSSGATKTGSGFVSGYIEAVSGDTIRVRCPNGTSYVGTGVPMIYLYNSSKAGVTGFYDSQTSNVTVDADGLGFSCKIARSECAFVRVAGQPTGAYSNFVVTKNELIV